MVRLQPGVVRPHGNAGRGRLAVLGGVRHRQPLQRGASPRHLVAHGAAQAQRAQRGQLRQSRAVHIAVRVVWKPDIQILRQESACRGLDNA